MNNLKQIIILGGGTSVQEGINKDLWSRITNKFVIGINYSYKWFTNPTIQCFYDEEVYIGNKKNSDKENMNKLGLLITSVHNNVPLNPNVIKVKTCDKYFRDIKIKGVYKSSLSGLLALTLGIYLLDAGEIFLCGYDYGEKRKQDFTKFINNSKEFKDLVIKDNKGRALTHWYQDKFEHRGEGKINYYNQQNRADKDFGVYKDEKLVKIYNVSKISKITTFPTITYDEFFQMLDKETYNQEELRQTIKNKLI